MIPMTFIEFIYSIVLVILITLCVLIAFFTIYKSINQNKTKLSQLTFEQLFEIVNLIISNEVSLYERNIFNNGGKILDKATYDNYYRDIMENVYKAFSTELVANITLYIDKESFYSMVSREIMVYLNNKII
jgi:hypothetical protein